MISIPNEVLEDFWQTKDNFIKSIAVAIYNSIIEMQKENDLKAMEGYTPKESKKVRVNILEKEFLTLCVTGYTSEILDMEFEGYNIHDVIKEFFKKNYNTEKGNYVEPLLKGISEYEGQYYLMTNPLIKINILKTEKHFFRNKHTCKFDLHPFLVDLLNEIEKIDIDDNVKLGYAQSVPSNHDGVYEEQPVYSEWIYTSVSKKIEDYDYSFMVGHTKILISLL